jgi:hypothetical protein
MMIVRIWRRANKGEDETRGLEVWSDFVRV